MVSEKGLVASVHLACADGIAHAHLHRKKLPGAASPTESLKVKQLMTATKRRHRKPVRKMEPVMAEVKRVLFKHFLPDGGNSGCALNNWR